VAGRDSQHQFHPVDLIDITFDFRSDTPAGLDPDSSSATLRKYHHTLWSRPLPNGVPFELDVASPPYLHHLSEQLGEFWLTSDSLIPTWSHWMRMAHIIDQIPEVEREEFIRIGYTIGGMMVWPGNKVGPMTINGARGCDPRIADRFDLTLECVRRYYLREPSSTGVLCPALARYPEFFALFGDFAGFVSFFLLQDLVDEAASTVKFFAPFEDFTKSPLPATLDAYRAYRERSIEFIEARNQRIAAHARGRPSLA
jgi:Family of unknown function (DUF6994)